jgi:hypothetical protein
MPPLLALLRIVECDHGGTPLLAGAALGRARGVKKLLKKKLQFERSAHRRVTPAVKSFCPYGRTTSLHSHVLIVWL